MPTSGEIAARVAAAPDRSVAGLRRLRRIVSRELREWNGADVLAQVEALLHAGCPRWFAYELAHHHRAARQQLTAARLRRLGAGLADWGAVDAFAVYLLGPAFREGRVSAAEIARWAKSDDRWQRRAALVCTVALNCTARGGSGDAPRTLAVCELLRADRDDMVVKAMSWALRELAVQDRRAVEQYLARREAELAPRVLREVRNKLSSGLKNPRH